MQKAAKPAKTCRHSHVRPWKGPIDQPFLAQHGYVMAQPGKCMGTGVGMGRAPLCRYMSTAQQCLLWQGNA